VEVPGHLFEILLSGLDDLFHGRGLEGHRIGELLTKLLKSWFGRDISVVLSAAYGPYTSWVGIRLFSIGSKKLDGFANPALPMSIVTLRTNVFVPGAEFTYERRMTADAAGSYAVRVANPGTYSVATSNGTQQIEVPGGVVRNGTAVGS